MSRQKRLFMAFHSFDYKHGAPLARERQGLKSLVGGHDAVEALRRGGIRIGELHLDVGCHYCAGNIYPDGVVEAVLELKTVVPTIDRGAGDAIGGAWLNAFQPEQ